MLAGNRRKPGESLSAIGQGRPFLGTRVLDREIPVLSPRGSLGPGISTQ